MERYRTVLVTGAAGFIGARLVHRLLNDPAMAETRFVLSDLAIPAPPDDGRVQVVEGDFGEDRIRRRLLKQRPDLVFHLAGVLGGAAEANYDLARRINIDATLYLLEGLRSPDCPPRVVMASSIAVFGKSDGSAIDDTTEPKPTLVYGAQKRMIEIALEQFSGRGWIDGIALRLPGVVARPGADTRLKSAFLNDLFHATADGRNIVLPVSPDGTTWLISVFACVEALMHAGDLAEGDLKHARTLTLPAQRVIFGELIEALRSAYPDSPSRIDFDPDPDIMAQFGRQPPLSTSRADALGFLHDGDLKALISRALQPVKH